MFYSNTIKHLFLFVEQLDQLEIYLPYSWNIKTGGIPKFKVEFNKTSLHSNHGERKFRVIFMEDHIPIRLDRSLLLGSQTSKWHLWDVIFHENNFGWLEF